jgi:pimeloyl-ACP methyl ester carboxylesterase
MSVIRFKGPGRGIIREEPSIMQQEQAVAPPVIVAGELIEIRPGRTLSIAIAEGAPDSDVTIFFCHGAGGNKNQWRHQWQALAGTGPRLVAWDCMGHGKSPQPRRKSAYAGSELVADYRAVVERYGSAHNILIAHSYGTRLTLAMLAASGEGRVDGAVLFGPPPPEANFRRGPIAWLPAFVLEWMRPQLSRGFRERAWHPATDPALIRAEEAETKGNSLFMMKSLLTQAVTLDPSSWQGLTLPITVVAGDGDRLTPPDGAERLARMLPSGTYRLIEGSGHQIMLEQPDQALALISGVLGCG